MPYTKPSKKAFRALIRPPSNFQAATSKNGRIVDNIGYNTAPTAISSNKQNEKEISVRSEISSDTPSTRKNPLQLQSRYESLFVSPAHAQRARAETTVAVLNAKKIRLAPSTDIQVPRTSNNTRNRRGQGTRYEAYLNLTGSCRARQRRMASADPIPRYGFTFREPGRCLARSEPAPGHTRINV